MKIIDLLNKIANDVIVPKKIKYDDIIFKNGAYQSESTYLQEYLSLDLSNLNDEIEILDNKKIEKLKKEKIISGMLDNEIQYIEEYKLEDVGDKINEIIDKINEVE